MYAYIIYTKNIQCSTVTHWHCPSATAATVNLSRAALPGGGQEAGGNSASLPLRDSHVAWHNELEMSCFIYSRSKTIFGSRQISMSRKQSLPWSYVNRRDHFDIRMSRQPAFVGPFPIKHSPKPSIFTGQIVCWGRPATTRPWSLGDAPSPNRWNIWSDLIWCDMWKVKFNGYTRHVGIEGVPVFCCQ